MFRGTTYITEGTKPLYEMALDPRQGLWHRTTLATTDGDTHHITLCNVWSTPKTRLSGSDEILADLPISELPVADPDDLRGWEIEIGPDIGTPVVTGSITDLGATITGLDWQTVVIAPIENKSDVEMVKQS